jgi:hypothetical protein
MPISSLISVSGFESLVPSCPPASTETLVPSAGAAAASRIFSASGSEVSPSGLDGTTVAYAVRPSADMVGLLASSGLLTDATPGSSDRAWRDCSTTLRSVLSVRVPWSVWKTIGLASVSSDENERPMMSLAAALSEPATVLELL